MSADAQFVSSQNEKKNSFFDYDAVPGARESLAEVNELKRGKLMA